MLLANICDLNDKNAPMMTLLHQSQVTKIFSLYLTEGKVKDCGCNNVPEVVFQVLEGKGTIYIGGVPHETAEGEVLLCPAGSSHRIEANLGADFRLLVVKPLKQ